MCINSSVLQNIQCDRHNYCAHFTDDNTDAQSMKEECTCMHTVHTKREADGGAQPRLALSLVLTFLWQAPILVSELFF